MEDFWTTFFYIIIMIAVIVAAYVATKYLSGKSRHIKSRYIRILDRVMLGKDKYVVLIEVGGQESADWRDRRVNQCIRGCR